MSKTWPAIVATAALVTVSVGFARAEDISAKKISIKDNANPAKRAVQVQSKDLGVQLSEADNPSLNGASIHVYSATDDLCVTLPSGADWKSTTKVWKYANKTTKNGAQVGNGKLSVKIKSGVTYTLADNGTQGTVNVQVQFGTGTKYCMKCTTPKKDTVKAYLGKDCVAAACDAEPSVCDPPLGTTTTTSTSTSTSTSTTTTTCPPGPPPALVLKGALPATAGRFNYNLTLGLPGANSACNTNFPGTHACTYQELQAAEAACDLPGLTDTTAATVTSFWAIDPLAPILQQCNDDAMGGSNLNWEYATAHTASRGQKVTLNNGLGSLGPLQSSIQCNIGVNASNWVGCCQ